MNNLADLNKNNILGIEIGREKIKEIINKVNHFFISQNKHFFHIANLNPDIFMLAYKDSTFRKIINVADSILIDGVGITWAARLYNVEVGERMTGTDLMQLLVKEAARQHKKVMFLGGDGNTAKRTGEYFQKLYSKFSVTFHPGAKDIKKETEEERLEVLGLIDTFKPELLFVAYGPPYQEKWIYESREHLKGIVCMGVGGSFKFFSGQIPRAPKLMIRFGLEWVWRFAAEPDRMIRKLPRHIYFLYLIFVKRLVNEK